MADLDLLVKELKEVSCSLHVVFLDQLNSPSPVKNISDYLNTFATQKERIQSVSSLLSSSISVADEPEGSEDEAGDPLERIPFPAFPWDILPPGWLEHFEDLAESIAVAKEGVVSSALTILSGAIVNQLQVSPKPGWKTSVAIWMALVGDSGRGKTPIIRNLMQGFYDSQQEAFDAYQKELKAFEENASKKGRPRQRRRRRRTSLPSP